MSRKTVHRFVAAGAVLALTSSAWTLAAASVQAAPLSACQWVDGDYSGTYDCAPPVDAVEHLDIVECWSMPPSPRTYVSTKAPKAPWAKTKAAVLTVNRSKDCDSAFPYRTRIRVPVEMLAEMQTTRLRLTMPATEGIDDQGDAYVYGKTVVTYGACLMPEDAGDWCPER